MALASLASLTSLCFWRRHDAAATVLPHPQVCPPPRRDAPLAAQGLQAVRLEFDGALADVGGDDALKLRRRIATARSLKELWHLRTLVYGLVAVTWSQAEAEQRLAALNRHFPTRSPRSGFAPLA